MDPMHRQNSDLLLANNKGFLSKIPDKDLPKMLFLAVNPITAETLETKETTSSASSYTDGGAVGVGVKVTSGEVKTGEDTDSIERTLKKLETVLREKNVTVLLGELQLRLLKLTAIEPKRLSNLNTLESNFSDNDDHIESNEEDVLAFTEIFELFGHSTPENIKTLFGKIIASKKIPVKQETTGYEKKSFFVYAENKIMMQICDLLTPMDVFNMYAVLRESEPAKSDDGVKKLISIPIDHVALAKVPGLKDAAFYYLILIMMSKKLINRLYTHRLVFLFEQLQEMKRAENKHDATFGPVLDILSRYPIASRPPGLCIIFTMNDGREGSQKDVQKVKELFVKKYLYDVFIKVNPSADDIKSIINKLKHARNKFYDSLVVFFMGHGDKTYLMVKDGKIHRRQELIEPFTEIEWFFKKPKLFFIQACAVKKDRKRVPSTSNMHDKKALPTQTDSAGWRASAGLDWQNKYADYTEITNINTYADTLISYATMWYQYASRGEEGCLYIDTLVDQLKIYGHKESIENVLRRVHYNVNTVSLSHSEQGEAVHWKQAPYFESSLQKEFRFNDFEKS